MTQRKVTATDDKQSSHIDCDMTLFIRLLEIAREDLKTDAQLHQLVERCSEQYAKKGAALTMDDYEALTSNSVLSSVTARLSRSK